jgi:ACT domain-containing protein
VKSSDDNTDLRALIARVSRQVVRRTGPRSDLAEIVAAEVTAALSSAPSSPPSPSSAPSSSPPSPSSPSPRRAESPTLRAELCASCIEDQRRKSGHRAVITTTGKNRKGIVAKIAQGIADAGGDILDISQTLVADYFTMIIIIDMSSLEVPFTEFKARLTETVRSLGAECLVMHEDVVTALQRI